MALKIFLPLVHVAIDHGIVHGVGHCQPIDCQIDILNILKIYWTFFY
jgi:hypothetical protein